VVASLGIRHIVIYMFIVLLISLKLVSYSHEEKVLLGSEGISKRYS